MMRREQRRHALVTSPSRQVDGLVDIREFRVGFAGGDVRVAMHRPTAIVVRDGAGERTIAINPERPDYAKWALPVAAFAVISIIARRRTHRARSMTP